MLIAPKKMKNNVHIVLSYKQQMDSTQLPEHPSHCTTNHKDTFEDIDKETREQGTATDHLICNCDCDQIARYKQKAHKSFMQVVQIQELYRDEIQQLKEFYEEKLKTQEKKHKCKEEFLQEKCKEFEKQLQKLSKNAHQNRLNQIDADFQAPFSAESIDSIQPAFLLDESSESINNLLDFVSVTNFQDNYQKLFAKMNTLMLEFKQNGMEKDKLTLSSKLHIIGIGEKVQREVKKIFDFVGTLMQMTVAASDKHNRLIKDYNNLQNKYSKNTALYQSIKKQSQFIAQHFKKVSQDKLTLSRKCTELQRINRNLQESVKMMRKELTYKSQPTSRVIPNKKAHQIKIYTEEDSCQNETIVIEQSNKPTLSSNKRVMTTPKNLGQSKAFSRALNFHRKAEPKDVEAK